MAIAMFEQGDPITSGVAEAPLLALFDPVADPSPEIRDRLAVYGPSALDEEDTLVLLLSRSSVPGGDLVGASAALLARFGGLARIFGAPEPELAQVIGVPAARELSLWHSLLLSVLEHPLRKRDVMSSHSAVTAYLRTRMGALPREEVRALYLDKKCQLISDELMSSGTVDFAPVFPREVVRRALELSASGILIAHCHPSGDPTPSSADIDITRQIVAAAEVLKIRVFDHMIVAGDQVASMRTLGLM